MEINLALSGANGRMGKAISNLVKLDNKFDLKLQLTRDSQIDQTVFSDKSIDVLIDFSTPNSCIDYLKICSLLKIPVVIGTTGFTKDQMHQISALSQLIPVVLAPNLSIGINLCSNLLNLLAKLWSKYYKDIVKIIINETHHQQKKDSPSGTALMLASILEKSLENTNANITINSKRIGKVKGTHEIIFTNDLEEIRLTHKVKQRKIFAKGALMAAAWLFYNKHNLEPKLYSFADLIALN